MAVDPCVYYFGSSYANPDGYPYVVTGDPYSLLEYFDGNTEPSDVDPYWDKVVLLLHFDGADGSTTITDSSQAGTVVTVNSDAQIDTAQSKFGGSSLLVNGTNDGISIPGLFNPNAVDWVVEFWYRSSATPESGGMLFKTEDSDGYTAVALIQTGATTVRLYLDSNTTAGWAYTSSSFTITANTWQHYMIRRNAEFGITNLFIDGVWKLGTTTTLYNASAATWIFGGKSSGTSSSVKGHFDEIRITNGVTRYATIEFTPPTTAFPEVGADPKPVSIVGCPATACEYKIDDGEWTSEPGEMDVYNQTLTPRLTLPESYDSFYSIYNIVTTFDVGGVLVCWSVTNAQPN
jgi:hypothetical protein